MSSDLCCSVRYLGPGSSPLLEYCFCYMMGIFSDLFQNKVRHQNTDVFVLATFTALHQFYLLGNETAKVKVSKLRVCVGGRGLSDVTNFDEQLGVSGFCFFG